MINDKCGSDIAIIGMAGQFPGAANVHQFWDNIANGICSISKFSDEELLASGVDSTLLGYPHYIKSKGYLDKASLFDAEFFGFAEYEAMFLDPQCRLFMQNVWTALEDAALRPDDASVKIGVFAGSTSIDNYRINNLLVNRSSNFRHENAAFLAQNASDFLTTLVAYKLNLTGPCMTIQTACSTSSVAIITAYEQLLSGKCDVAVAGGVSITTPLKAGYYYQEGTVLSSDGVCRAFDANANGAVPGCGLGVLILKRLDKAINDRDSIHAIIKGGSVNNDGSHKIGFAAPSIAGQKAVINAAFQEAGVDISQVSLIEMHGTGTKIGDLIEFSALSEFFFDSGVEIEKESVALGTLKPNIGHLDVASGVSSVIKIVMALKNKKIPPTINYQSPNPLMKMHSSPFYIPTQVKDWNTESARIAGVSSFGIGGTNAHIILEEYSSASSQKCSELPVLFVLSANKRSALIRKRRDLVRYLEKHPSVDLSSLAYTLQVGRVNMPDRFCCICSSADEAIECLNQLNAQVIIDNEFAITSEVSHRALLKDIATAWLLGGEYIDWHRCYKGEMPYKLSLPTYPFEGREYWIAAASNIVHDVSSELAENKGSLDGVPLKTIEAQLLEIFKYFLGSHQLDTVSDLNSLEMDSLLMLQMLQKIKKDMGVDLSIDVFFESSSLNEMARKVYDLVKR